MIFNPQHLSMIRFETCNEASLKRQENNESEVFIVKTKVDVFIYTLILNDMLKMIHNQWKDPL